MKLNISQIKFIPFLHPYLAIARIPTFIHGMHGMLRKTRPSSAQCMDIWMARWRCKNTYIVMMNIKQGFRVSTENVNVLLPLVNPVVPTSRK